MRILKWMSHIFVVLTILGGLYVFLGPKPWNSLFWMIPMVLSHAFNYLSNYIEKRQTKHNK